MSLSKKYVCCECNEKIEYGECYWTHFCQRKSETKIEGGKEIWESSQHADCFLKRFERDGRGSICPHCKKDLKSTVPVKIRHPTIEEIFKKQQAEKEEKKEKKKAIKRKREEVQAELKRLRKEEKEL